MGTQFDRWEIDPFFPAAEEVQESADRMESTYRTWIHAKKDPSGMWNVEELRRDLRTRLGTTKWQLEEFERAVTSSYTENSSVGAKDRHREFIVAMNSQISKVESCLNESAASTGKPPRPWVRLDEGESKELTLFLSGAVETGNEKFANNGVKDKPPVSKPEVTAQVAAKDEKLHGHRRTASASADIEAWKIPVSDDVAISQGSTAQPEKPPRKIPSFSGFLNTMESASKLKWSKNGYRKLKHSESHQDADLKLPQTQPLTRSINACYERSKSCLDGCDDCDKQLYGWYGAVQRQLQRSQYYMQYSRRTQMFFWIMVLLCLLALVGIHVI